MNEVVTYMNLHKVDEKNVQGTFKHRFELSYCDYEFSKDITSKGQANSILKGGNIKAAIIGLPQQEIIGWLFNIHSIENGEITTHNIHSEVIEKIQFSEARLVGFKFHYDSLGMQNATTILTINAQRITMGDNEYINEVN